MNVEINTRNIYSAGNIGNSIIEVFVPSDTIITKNDDGTTNDHSYGPQNAETAAITTIASCANVVGVTASRRTTLTSKQGFDVRIHVA